MERFKDRKYHVIEMRITLICSFAVFLKLFLSEVLTQGSEEMLTYSALIFIGRE